MRAVSVAAWCRRSWGRNPSGAPVAFVAALQASENVARRKGPPSGPVKTGESASGRPKGAQVIAPRVDDDGRQSDDPPAGLRLRRIDVATDAGQLLRLALDVKLAVEQVDVSPAKAEALPGAQPGEPGQENHAAITGADGLGQLKDQ